MSYTAEEKRLMIQHMVDNPQDEIFPASKAEELEHIFGKWCKELRVNPLNFAAVSAATHRWKHTQSPQAYVNAICDVKIERYGQAFTDFADKYGGKLWRVYKEMKWD